MQIKQGVVINGLNPIFRYVLPELEKIYKKNGSELVVTSAIDGTHSAGSKHYYGNAIDIRVKNLPVEKWQIVRDEISACLGCCFKVILETQNKGSEHIHLEVLI